MTDPLSSGPRSVGDSINDRLVANEKEYNMRFVERYRDALTRLQRDGDLPSGTYDFRGADPAALNELGGRLVGNLPVARAIGDEARDWFKDQPFARQALVTTFHLVRARRLELARTVRFGEDGERVRLRGVFDGRSDRIEANYTKPTLLGDVEVKTAVRRGLDKPGYTAGVGLRSPCGIACNRFDLVSERRDDGAKQRQVVAFTASRVYNNGLTLTGGIERVRDAQGRSETRAGVGLIFAYL